MAGGFVPFSVNTYPPLPLGDPTTQNQDIFASVVQFKAVRAASGNRTLRYLAAGAGGLVIAGLIVVLVAIRRRRRSVEPPPAAKTRERDPVGVS